MPFALFLIGLDIALVAHANKTGRFTPWGYIIMFVPGFGALAYIVMVIVPDWLGGYSGQAAQRKVLSKVDPDRRYRALSQEVQTADTLANREAIAREAIELERYDEALTRYDEILADRLGDEPRNFLGKAQALIGLGRPLEAIDTLDALRAQRPDYPSQEGHLMYAVALEMAGRDDESLEEFDALVDYYAGAKARFLRAQQLRKMGHEREARAAAEEIVRVLRNGPRHVKKLHGEWLKAAEQLLRDTDPSRPPA